MPDKSILEEKNVPVEEIQQLLDKMQSIKAVAEHYQVHPRTVTRYIDGKLERRSCWFQITTIEAKASR